MGWYVNVHVSRWGPDGHALPRNTERHQRMGEKRKEKIMACSISLQYHVGIRLPAKHWLACKSCPEQRHPSSSCLLFPSTELKRPPSPMKTEGGGVRKIHDHIALIITRPDALVEVNIAIKTEYHVKASLGQVDADTVVAQGVAVQEPRGLQDARPFRPPGLEPDTGLLAPRFVAVAAVGS